MSISFHVIFNIKGMVGVLRKT